MPYKDPEVYLAYQREYHREHYYADQDASRAKGRSNYHKYKDLDQLKAKHQERMATDPEYRDATRKRKNAYNKRKLVNQKRRARLAGASVIESVDRLTVANLHDWICGLCGLPVDPDAKRFLDNGKLNPEYLHIDHIVSLSNGGEHSYANCQPAHAWCNWSKNNADQGMIRSR